MAEELGQIEKPEASKFLGKKKIYLVVLVGRGKDSPPDYIERFELYWKQVAEYVANLELKIGKVNYIYHESVFNSGEEGLKLLEKLSPESFNISKEKCQNGAVLEVIEDKALAEEGMDWERFLMTGFISQKVARMVTDFYLEASRKRYEHIAQKVNETLKEGEAALLFIREGHRVQFPREIEVFSVAPPALDELHRWIRDFQTKQEEQERESGVKSQET